MIKIIRKRLKISRKPVKTARENGKNSGKIFRNLFIINLLVFKTKITLKNN